jgi:hypothetical protein
MNALNNLFAKTAKVKNLTDFTHFSLNVAQMKAIKGGTEPILPPPPPTTPPGGGGGI